MIKATIRVSADCSLCLTHHIVLPLPIPAVISVSSTRVKWQFVFTHYGRQNVSESTPSFKGVSPAK